MPSANTVARAIRYATALILQAAFWGFTAWYMLVAFSFILWSALTDKEPGCFISAMLCFLLLFVTTGWVCSRIAKALLEGKLWSLFIAAGAGFAMAAASTYSAFSKPDQNLHYLSNALGFSLWAITLTIMAIRGAVFGKPY